MPTINITGAQPAPDPQYIRLNINPPEDPNMIRIEIVNPDVEKVTFSVQARRALNGDIMIFDHKDIDIVIMNEKKKDRSICKRFNVRSCIRRRV